MIDELQRRVDASRYDNWEVYFFMAATLIGVSIWMDIRFVTGILYSLDNVEVSAGYNIDQILIAAIQGIVLSIIGSLMFTQGDSYFAFLTSSFDTKEMTFIVRVGVMTLIGIAVTLVIPDLIYRHAELVVIQTLGGVFLIGYVMIHNDIKNWKLLNEAPVLAAGLILVAAPFLWM